MTNYNDGNWHRWDGIGHCPVHSDSEVEVWHLSAGWPRDCFREVIE